MKIGSILFAALILAIGLVYEGMALYMPLGSLAYPGPGLFPMCIGIFLIATALGCLVQEILTGRKGAGPSSPPLSDLDSSSTEGRDVRKTIQLLILMVIYVLVLKTAGFPIAIAGFLGIAIRIFGQRRWLPTLALAAVIAAISYVSFILWLKVPLPMGILDEILG